MSFELKVIGAGLGRTGTTSLKAALEMLLGGPCFHFLEYRDHPELMDPWRELVETMPLHSDPETYTDVPISRWEKLMPGCVACVDEPASYYWKQLYKCFPDALFILSLRDADSWRASMKALDEYIREERKQPDLISPERREFHKFLDAIYPEPIEGRSDDEEKAFFEAHNRRVLEYAERDPSFEKRLLVWRAGDGWEPICEALDLPVPDVPFPHKNKRAEYHGY